MGGPDGYSLNERKVLGSGRFTGEGRNVSEKQFMDGFYLEGKERRHFFF